MSILQRSITDLKGVGQQLATRLAKLQIKSFQDILFHLPNRYIDRTRIHPIATLRFDDIVVVEGTIEAVSIIPKPKRTLNIKIRDASGRAELKFFYFNVSQQAQLQVGSTVRCFGQVRSGRSGIQFIHPEYKVLTPGVVLPVEEFLTPIYPATDGVSQNLLRSLVKQVITVLQPISTSLEILPDHVIQNLNFLPIIECLQQLHFPTPECFKQVLNTGVHPAQRRLAFEELLAQHLSLKLKRQGHMQKRAQPIICTDVFANKLLATLPFRLTNAQCKAIDIVSNDMRQNFPMLRLVQGDVGSGKTLVAVMAALNVIEAGGQVAFMAPTEILVDQHFKNLQQWLDPLGIKIAVLTGSLSAKEKLEISRALHNNEIQLLVGTHALFQDNIKFSNLILIIIDEQHRFGVAQRLALHNKGSNDQFCPHQLILTATPIPRTLAMTFYADLDYAVIDELPPGRKPITTLMISTERRPEILTRITNLCAQGQQVYWVCTLIEESEVIDCTPAEIAAQELQTQLPNLQVALLHGKMPAAQKEQIMQAFKAGTINLLVATTVIEVGVDVPNASLMVIENPERLGLAQLHQLRGRVGRGNNQSYCILLYKKPLGERASQRLQFLRDSQDGFALAEFDLKLRGPGEVFGTRQSGLANLRVADLMRDKDLLPKVHTVADQILRDTPEIIPALLQRWIREQLQYSEV